MAECRSAPALLSAARIIHLAEGDTERLLHFIGAAKTDYRDVIHWAEYDRNDQRLRDFNQPFDAQSDVPADGLGPLGHR